MADDSASRDDAALIVDEEDTVLAWSSLAEKCLGYSAHETVGHSLTTLFDKVALSIPDGAQIAEHIKLEGRYARYHLIGRKSGEFFLAEISAHLRQTKSNGILRYVDITPLGPGHSDRTVDGGSAGRQAATCSTEMLIEFGELIDVVKSQANALGVGGRPSPDPLVPRPLNQEQVEQLRGLSGAAGKLSDQWPRLRAIIESTAELSEVASLNRAIRESESVLRQFAREEIDFGFDLQEGLWPIRMVIGQFENLLANLVLDAREDIPSSAKARPTPAQSKPHFHIKTENLALEEPRPDSASPTPWVQMTISFLGSRNGTVSNAVPLSSDPRNISHVGAVLARKFAEGLGGRLVVLEGGGRGYALIFLLPPGGPAHGAANRVAGAGRSVLEPGENAGSGGRRLYPDKRTA